jgi:hypothetical protein
MISRWLEEQSKDEVKAFRGTGKLTAEQLKIPRLRKELRRVTMEKGIGFN